MLAFNAMLRTEWSILSQEFDESPDLGRLHSKE